MKQVLCCKHLFCTFCCSLSCFWFILCSLLYWVAVCLVLLQFGLWYSVVRVVTCHCMACFMFFLGNLLYFCKTEHSTQHGTEHTFFLCSESCCCLHLGVLQFVCCVAFCRWVCLMPLHW